MLLKNYCVNENKEPYQIKYDFLAKRGLISVPTGRIPRASKAQRQQQMFYLCESAATATIVLSVRKRSDSDSNNKASSLERKSPHLKCQIFTKISLTILFFNTIKTYSPE
ncbi:hypothetical protein ACIQXF_09665 [Lysinibacillus sp. NPDC097231]|uniref:hypothetical protein n=1 Tax=Lysinibacillus sp. NPDC097231 TaxID=3364142 RepID=UPI00382A8200